MQPHIKRHHKAPHDTRLGNSQMTQIMQPFQGTLSSIS